MKRSFNESHNDCLCIYRYDGLGRANLVGALTSCSRNLFDSVGYNGFTTCGVSHENFRKVSHENVHKVSSFNVSSFAADVSLT